jgi:hypothetical protein
MLPPLLLREGGGAFSWNEDRVPISGKSIPRRSGDI